MWKNEQKHTWIHMTATFACVALLASCGSKQDEDRKALEQEQAAQKKPSQPGGSVAVLKIPGETADAQSELADPCLIQLQQQSPVFNGNKVTANFVGKLKAGCATDSKQLILYIKTGENRLQLPAQLDCQPKGKEGWNIRCLNTKGLVNEKGEASLSLEADANYRGSLTAMQLAFEDK